MALAANNSPLSYLMEQRQRLFLYIFLPLTVALALIIPFLSLSNILLFLLLVTYFIFVIACFHNEWGLFLFILLRPIVDFSTATTIFQINNFNLNLAALLGIAIIIFTIWIIIKNYPAFKKISLLIPWLIFLSVNILSLFFSISLNASLAELARLLTIFSLFVLGFLIIKNNQDLTRLIKVIIFSSLVPSAVAFYQFITGTGLKEGYDLRLFGTFAHPNMLAFFLCFIIVLTVFIFLNNDRKKISSLLYGLLMFFSLFLLVFTYTRGAWLVFFIFISLVGSFSFRRFLILICGLVLLFYMAWPSFQDRINTLVNPDPYGSINWRLELWQDGFTYFKKEPIIGYGSGTAALVIADNRGLKLGSPEPHNDYLRLALDTGLLGLLAYGILIVSLISSLLFNYFKQKRPKLKMFNLFLVAFGVALYIMSFGDNVLNDTALEWSFWVLVGALLAVQIKDRRLVRS
ncbi:MAG: O-antigen ligase family protein [Patescibacteria group bacterium]|jgi:O-antigen ligase